MKTSTRLDTLRRLLLHTREQLSLDLGFVLWDGSTVPADLAGDALAIRLADEGVVAALLRRPNIDTLANLWVTARLDIRGGTIFDLAARRPRIRSRALFKSVNKTTSWSRWPAS